MAAACCAQEHLTCLRSDQAFTQQSPQTPQKALQGAPGKRGPKGEKGVRGIRGQKGEREIFSARQIDLLRDQLNTLSEEVEAMKNQSKKNRQLVMDVFSKGLYIPPHVYVYKLSPGSQSWLQSREFCQNWGGDLAVHGVKLLENRKKLIQNLVIDNRFWIGANDIFSEDNWRWVNGQVASRSELIWIPGQPNNHGNEQDCAFVIAENSSFFGLAGDQHCHKTRYLALCEIKL